MAPVTGYSIELFYVWHVALFGQKTYFNLFCLENAAHQHKTDQK